MPAHGTCFALAPDTRAYNEVMRTVANGFHQNPSQISAIRTVAVKKQDYPALRPSSRHTRRARTTITALGQRNDARTRRTRDCRRSIAAGAVSNNDLVHHIARDGCNRARNRLSLVQRWNNRRNAIHGSTIVHRRSLRARRADDASSVQWMHNWCEHASFAPTPAMTMPAVTGSSAGRNSRMDAAGYR